MHTTQATRHTPRATRHEPQDTSHTTQRYLADRNTDLAHALHNRDQTVEVRHPLFRPALAARRSLPVGRRRRRNIIIILFAIRSGWSWRVGGEDEEGHEVVDERVEQCGVAMREEGQDVRERLRVRKSVRNDRGCTKVRDSVPAREHGRRVCERQSQKGQRQRHEGRIKAASWVGRRVDKGVIRGDTG
eukprot:1810057-Rhodomonas_salina.1